MRVACPESIDNETGPDLLEEVRALTGEHKTVLLDLSDTMQIDSKGGAWLVQVADAIRAKGAELEYEGQHGPVADFMDMIAPGLQPLPKRNLRKLGVFEQIGDNFFKNLDEFREFRAMFVDAIYWMIIGPAEGRKLRLGLVVDELHEMGVRAVPINGMMNFLLGLIIAMLTAQQAEDIGSPILVAMLLVIGFTRELAAVMTAVVVSARTGAAITAELATMKVQEEIDALRGMGLNVPQFLIAPKIIALTIVMPCLTALGMVFGFLGGSLWGVTVMGVEPYTWLNYSESVLELSDVSQGLIKSFVFAFVIALIGCHNGLRVQGGSRGVGLVTTRTVVMDIFFIIIIDMCFAMLFYYIL